MTTSASGVLLMLIGLREEKKGVFEGLVADVVLIASMDIKW